MNHFHRMHAKPTPLLPKERVQEPQVGPARDGAVASGVAQPMAAWCLSYVVNRFHRTHAKPTPLLPKERIQEPQVGPARDRGSGVRGGAANGCMVLVVEAGLGLFREATDEVNCAETLCTRQHVVNRFRRTHAQADTSTSEGARPWDCSERLPTR